ncbi:MAG TPA: cytochrome ubiquinol oxidase subunit I [Ilumatobacter sp.]|nr:cytochrome ubiquinol oxidase subunit I [Ilumatobacter sp.]
MIWSAAGPLLANGALLPARNQMALSLGWHIVLACFGMTFPAMIFIVHRRGIRGDEAALTLARRWSKVAAVLFAIGAVSGTILSFEMGLLWPGLMERYGDVIGLAFTLEGVSFFIEAIFLGIYVYGWDRLPPRQHLLMLAPIMAAGVFGSFLVISVNSWMNAPTGFTTIDGSPGGAVADVDPLRAIFNSAVGLQFLHMYAAAVMVVGFSVAGVYAMGWLRGRHDRLHRLGILVPLTFAVVVAPLQPLIGHFAGQRVAAEQPIKLAAMEGLSETTSSARLELGGWWNGDELVGAIEVPVDGLLSFIATNDFDSEVIGLDSVPPEDRPPVGIVHMSFQIMVALGTLLAGVAAWTAWRWWRQRDRFFESTWFLRALVLAGPAALAATEFGWITTEVGRQPWIVYRLLRTEDAVTDSGFIWLTLTVLIVVYTAMTAGAIALIRSMSRRWRDGEVDLASPYGPAAFDTFDSSPEDAIA